uniref:Membrane-associated kinase regulator n=1 Tax=Mesocestoides corti TaxID=53468 RepID=A0A5K3EJ95_MESCO
MTSFYKICMLNCPIVSEAPQSYLIFIAFFPIDLLTSGRLAEMRKQFEIQEHPPANHRKSSFSNKKPLLSAAEDTLSKISSKSGPAKVHPDDCHARLLLSTLSRDQEYVSTLVRRLRHGTVVPPSPPSGGSSTTRKSACQKSLTLKRSSVFGGRGGCGTDSERKSSVFKIPHLPNPSRQLSSASLSVGTLLRRGKGHLMGRRRAKSKTASLLVGATERHSFAGLEQLASRLGSVNGVSRQPSNVSDGVTKSSSDDFGIFDSASSSTSLGRQRTSSLSSLVACTEDLFSQYFSSVSPPNQD